MRAISESGHLMGEVASATNTLKEGRQPAHDPKSFVMWCVDAVSDVAILETINALYYLPQHFTLALPLTAALDNAVVDAIAQAGMAGRVAFREHADAPDNAAATDAVVYDASAEAHLARRPERAIVISTTATEALAQSGLGHFTISARNPEALASAALRLSRV